jgi:hypothetical protein
MQAFRELNFQTLYSVIISDLKHMKQQIRDAAEWVFLDVLAQV